MSELDPEAQALVMQLMETLRRCCPTCVHFDRGAEQCKLVWVRPPAHVIAYGCASYTRDPVPW